MILETKDALTEIGSPYESLTSGDIHRRYHPAIKVNSGHVAVYDPMGGTLRADKCMKSLQVSIT